VNRKINLNVNGETWPVEVESSDTLLDVLRTQVGVKSPKIGCEMGDCGTCTVLLDGRTVRSCLVLAVEVEGQQITTVEGLGDGELTPLQRSFLKHNAFQCGFCSPGTVVAATELLERNSRPTDDEIKEAISGNLCRCTGYQPIIEAIREVGDRAGKKVDNK